MGARFEISVQELSGPQLAVTRDEFDDALGSEPRDPNTPQHFLMALKSETTISLSEELRAVPSSSAAIVSRWSFSTA